ncbi:ABC transporter [Phytophthora cinnamomi]|uniref:ABC transporter n=1 Tax=Phytophthora cinnamomi TaxID=4785 RepID=UPI003559D4B7|nr:ABC transporter [Phytophthora cinnamomi]
MGKSQTPGQQRQTSLADAPPVKIHVAFKRESMKLHGQSEFDVFAKPVVSGNGASVLYDGYAEFTEDGKSFTYSYVSGVGQLSTTDGEKQCISSTTLPFDDILPSLNDAVPIPSASIGDETIECTRGNLFKTTFAGAHFAICLSDKSGFKAYSSDIDIEVEYLENSVEIQVPPLSSGLSCEVAAKPSSVVPTTLALLTGSAVPTSTSRTLKAAEHMAMEASTCECKSKPRPCVFFHGIGNRHEMEELQDTPKKASGRMGNMNKHAPCCTEVKYAILNTMDYSWTNDSLQQKFCDRALRLSSTSDVDLGVIKDTVVVTHSMGGLVMSMALATGKCRFGDGATWVALSSPMLGSMASDYFQDFCNDEISVFMTDLLEFFGQCPMPVARQSLMYYKDKYASKELNEAYKLAQAAYRGNVSAAMCSDNPNGIFSVYEAIMLLAAKVVPHKSPENDALVEFQSCAKGLDKSKFGKSYKDKFYRPELNHADTVFLTGDGYFKNSQKPVKWFECLL